MSGEIEGNINKEFSKLILEIGKELENLENDTYGSEVEEIGVIPIIVKIIPEYEESGFF
ncbi:hypothetical protein BACCIP111899_03025 [Bacillus rhizoplanae]|uniref:Uncharacterized protein n=1 Tax=Bacillus rhizoplanae TaxID=2880966 RepID=A0ABN8A4G5_9BACI|nr:hypothetical protein BACCIP111899_03025 [Bacillus rhizoplanae]